MVTEALVLLHGFGGTRRAWDGVVAHLDGDRWLPLAIDLPGHGDLAVVAGPITFESCVEAVLERSPERFALCGYSMGGRVALHVALAVPERISRLTLVSSTAGIEDPDDRHKRRMADRALAEELGRAPFEQFIDRWRAQPLFAGDPAQVDALARDDHRRNRPRSLAVALRGVGTGEMEPLWERLDRLSMPTDVLAGTRDEKFRAIGTRLAERLPHGRLHVMEGGHVLPLENPAAVADALQTPVTGRRRGGAGSRAAPDKPRDS